MHTFRKLPKINPSKKNVAAKKYVFSRRKLFRARSADGRCWGDYTQGQKFGSSAEHLSSVILSEACVNAHAQSKDHESIYVLQCSVREFLCRILFAACLVERLIATWSQPAPSGSFDLLSLRFAQLARRSG